MTEAQREIAATENEDSASGPPADPEALLARAVRWVAVLAFVYAAGCAVSVLFGIQAYRIEMAEPPSVVRSRAVHYLQMFIIGKLTVLCALIFLGRAAWRYARALARARSGDAPADAATLAKDQLSCWQAVTWAALLYAGWEATRAFAG